MSALILRTETSIFSVCNGISYYNGDNEVSPIPTTGGAIGTLDPATCPMPALHNSNGECYTPVSNTGDPIQPIFYPYCESPVVCYVIVMYTTDVTMTTTPAATTYDSPFTWTDPEAPFEQFINADLVSYLRAISVSCNGC